jgi:outer membrane protein
MLAGASIPFAPFAPAAHGETLADAIALAYQNNPTLQEQRAQLRGLDENYVEAAVGLRPTVTAQAEATYSELRYGKATIAANAAYTANPLTKLQTNTSVGQVIVQQPLYTSGRVATQVRTAEDQIKAGRQGLRADEGDLMLNVINAYSSVRRDERILAVWRASVEQFTHQVEEAEARFKAGDATQTDVEQARAQLALERASMASATQQLESSRTSYTQLVGQNPGTLAPEPELPNLPVSVDTAFDKAEANSPELAAAVLTEASSRASIASARAAYRPTLSLQTSYGYTGDVTPISGKNLERDLNAQVVLSQPLFSGGLLTSNVRKAIEQNNADRINIEVVRRQVNSNIANYWNQMLIARQNVDLQALQVKSARATYVGMQEEYHAGQRSTFDVLYAEEILRDAQIAELTAVQAAYAGEAGVLRYTGSLQAQQLAAGVPVYDAAANTRRVIASGALPWDGAVLAIDSLGAPSEGQKPLSSPPLAANPVPRAAKSQPSPGTPLATTLPTMAMPGTSAGFAPPQLRHDDPPPARTQSDTISTSPANP